MASGLQPFFLMHEDQKDKAKPFQHGAEAAWNATIWGVPFLWYFGHDFPGITFAFTGALFAGWLIFGACWFHYLFSNRHKDEHARQGARPALPQTVLLLCILHDFVDEILLGSVEDRPGVALAAAAAFFAAWLILVVARRFHCFLDRAD